MLFCGGIEFARGVREGGQLRFVHGEKQTPTVKGYAGWQPLPLWILTEHKGQNGELKGCTSESGDSLESSSSFGMASFKGGCIMNCEHMDVNARQRAASARNNSDFYLSILGEGECVALVVSMTEF